MVQFTFYLQINIWQIYQLQKYISNKMAIISAADFITMSFRITFKDSCNCWKKQCSINAPILSFQQILSEFKWAGKIGQCIYLFSPQNSLSNLILLPVSQYFGSSLILVYFDKSFYVSETRRGLLLSKFKLIASSSILT